MNGRMLTAWSQEYVDALFKSDLAKDPLLGRFWQEFEREAFIAGLKARAHKDMDVVPLDDGRGVRLTGATPQNLLEVVRLAARYGGEILFPGALQGQAGCSAPPKAQGENNGV